MRWPLLIRLRRHGGAIGLAKVVAMLLVQLFTFEGVAAHA